MPIWSYNADNKYNIEWSFIDEIKFFKHKHYNNIYKDNGGSFFEYLNNSPQYKRVNDYFVRLQIFDNLDNNKGKMREELTK